MNFNEQAHKSESEKFHSSGICSSIHGPCLFCGNPCVGKDDHKTFESQSTFVLPVRGKEGAFIFMADLWRPENPIDGRYVWLPIQWKHGHPVIEWLDEWDLTFFDRMAG